MRRQNAKEPAPAVPASLTRAHLKLLRLQQLFDSLFPIGAFAHSAGLETYSHLPGFDKDSLAGWLRAQLEYGWGRLDLAAFALAWRGAEEPLELERIAAETAAWKAIPGQRLASERLGRRLLVLAKRLFTDSVGDLSVKPPQQPVIAGAVTRKLGLPEPEALLLFAQSNLTAALAAATRCMPLSPEQAQEALTLLQPPLAEAVWRALAEPESSFFNAAPASDVRAHQQTHLHTRLFQS